MSTTVGDLIDRTLRTYLEPPDHQPAFTFLSAGIAAGASSLVLDEFLIPEDEELVRAGSILEAGSELFLVSAYDEFTRTCTLDPTEKFGTTAAAHAAGTRVKLSPPYSRQSIFEAIADNIIGLYPDLYSVNTANVAPIGNVAALDDNLAVEVISILGPNGLWAYDGEIVDFHPLTGTRSVVLNVTTGDAWVKYRRRFGSATAETDSLSSLGVDPRWERIVMVGACADLLVGRDLPRSETSWVGQALEAENIPVGTRTSLTGALSTYRDQLIRIAKKEMRAEYRSTTQEATSEALEMGVW